MIGLWERGEARHPPISRIADPVSDPIHRDDRREARKGAAVSVPPFEDATGSSARRGVPTERGATAADTGPVAPPLGRRQSMRRFAQKVVEALGAYESIPHAANTGCTDLHPLNPYERPVPSVGVRLPAIGLAVAVVEESPGPVRSVPGRRRAIGQRLLLARRPQAGQRGIMAGSEGSIGSRLSV